MLELTLNGEYKTIDSQSLLSLVEKTCAQSPPPQGIAVAINGVVVRRSQWSTTQLHAGDDIEILWASSGG